MTANQLSRRSTRLEPMTSQTTTVSNRQPIKVPLPPVRYSSQPCSKSKTVSRTVNAPATTKFTIITSNNNSSNNSGSSSSQFVDGSTDMKPMTSSYLEVINDDVAFSQQMTVEIMSNVLSRRRQTSDVIIGTKTSSDPSVGQMYSEGAYFGGDRPPRRTVSELPVLRTSVADPAGGGSNVLARISGALKPVHLRQLGGVIPPIAPSTSLGLTLTDDRAKKATYDTDAEIRRRLKVGLRSSNNALVLVNQSGKAGVSLTSCSPITENENKTTVDRIEQDGDEACEIDEFGTGPNSSSVSATTAVSITMSSQQCHVTGGPTATAGRSSSMLQPSRCSSTITNIPSNSSSAAARRQVHRRQVNEEGTSARSGERKLSTRKQSGFSVADWNRQKVLHLRRASLRRSCLLGPKNSYASTTRTVEMLSSGGDHHRRSSKKAIQHSNFRRNEPYLRNSSSQTVDRFGKIQGNSDTTQTTSSDETPNKEKFSPTSRRHCSRAPAAAKRERSQKRHHVRPADNWQMCAAEGSVDRFKDHVQVATNYRQRTPLAKSSPPPTYEDLPDTPGYSKLYHHHTTAKEEGCCKKQQSRWKYQNNTTQSSSSRNNKPSNHIRHHQKYEQQNSPFAQPDSCDMHREMLHSRHSEPVKSIPAHHECRHHHHHQHHHHYHRLHNSPHHYLACNHLPPQDSYDDSGVDSDIKSSAAHLPEHASIQVGTAPDLILAGLEMVNSALQLQQQQQHQARGDDDDGPTSAESQVVQKQCENETPAALQQTARNDNLDTVALIKTELLKKDDEQSTNQPEIMANRTRQSLTRKASLAEERRGSYYRYYDAASSSRRTTLSDSKSSTPAFLEPQDYITDYSRPVSSMSSSIAVDEITSLPGSPFYRQVLQRRSSSIDSSIISRPGSDFLDVPILLVQAKDRSPSMADLTETSSVAGDSPISTPVQFQVNIEDSQRDLQQQVVHRISDTVQLPPVTPCQSPDSDGAHFNFPSTIAKLDVPVAVQAPQVSLTTDDGDDFDVWFGRRGSIFIEEKGGNAQNQQVLLQHHTTVNALGQVSLAVPKQSDKKQS